MRRRCISRDEDFTRWLHRPVECVYVKRFRQLPSVFGRFHEQGSSNAVSSTLLPAITAS